MVHALERAGEHIRDDGVLVAVQPHQSKRPFVAIRTPGSRQPVGALVSPAFQPLIDAAIEAIQTVVEAGLFVRIGASHHRFRVHLASLAELRRYLHLGQRPPRFPPGGRRRLLELWRRRGPGARIEVTEFLTVIGLRVRRR
jgi:hypothetical protein